MAERPSSRPHSRLVPHDIRLTRVENEDGASEVVATIACERRHCTLRVETCAECERFARIETHEAGYVMLCRSADAVPAQPIIAAPSDSSDSTEPP